MLTKLLQVVAQLQFKTLLESQGDYYEPRQSTMDQLYSNLKGKLELAFQNAEELMRFMDLSEKESAKAEEFVFAV